MKGLITLLMGVILYSQTGYACQFDTDCELGTICIKPFGGDDGWCSGEFKSTDLNIHKHSRDQDELMFKRGKSCQVDTDCGPGGSCAKGTNDFGTCV